MPTPYSVRFLNELAPIGAGPVFEVPAGYRCVVRSISISSGQPGPTGCQVYVGAAICYQNLNIVASGFAEWHGHQVANAGERITTYINGGSLFVLVSGYQLIDDGP